MTGFADILRWLAGNRFAQASMDLMAGRIDWSTAVGYFAQSYANNLANQVAGSVLPRKRSTPGRRSSVLTLEPLQTTLPKATQL